MKGKVKVKSLSRVRLLATPWTGAYRLLLPWDFPGESTGVGAIAFSFYSTPADANSFVYFTSSTGLQYGIYHSLHSECHVGEF